MRSQIVFVFLLCFLRDVLCSNISDEDFWRQLENEMLVSDFTQELPFRGISNHELFWDQFQHDLTLPPPAVPEIVTSDNLYSVEPSSELQTPMPYIPSTPGSQLTNALGELNLLSPSLFNEYTNPFDTLFGSIIRPVSPQPIPHNDFLTPIVPSTSFPEQSEPQPQPGPSHVQNNKVVKPTPRRRHTDASVSRSSSTRGRHMPTVRTEERRWQCDECQKTFARQGKPFFT